MATDLTPNIDGFYVCNLCDYKCSKESAWNRHIITRKHTRQQNSTDLTPCCQTFSCEHCNKQYKDRTGLWKHKKKCIKEEQQLDLIIKEKEPENNFNLEEALKLILIPLEKKLLSQESEQALIPEFIKQTQETQMQMFQQMMEFMKQQCATTTNINNGQINNNNNNYTHFNLQVYLNETCKNAMTINQFLDYLEPTVEELEATAHLGYVEGISRIIMRGFKNLEEYELPFHCSDLKREHIYLKNPDDEWVEEKDEKPLLLRFIKEVAKKSFKNLSAWQKKNPNWANYNSKQNDLFNKIVGNSVSGATEEEQQANYEKIMKNIMKNIVIDKSKKNK